MQTWLQSAPLARRPSRTAKPSSEWYSLVDPDDQFDPMNVSIHGIDESMVTEAPTYRDVGRTVAQLLGDAVVVTHTHFDRVAMHQAAHRWGIEPPRCN